MDKELENILRGHFERKKELGQKSWDKINHLFEMVDDNLNFKSNITDDEVQFVRKTLVQFNKDYRDLEFETHAKFMKFNPKDDYNDFAKCFLTQDILNHVRAYTDPMIESFENGIGGLYQPNQGTGHRATQHGIGIKNVEYSYMEDPKSLTINQKEFIHELYTEKRFKPLKDKVLEHCGGMQNLLSEVSSELNNNSLLAKINNNEIAK
jgi:hypothetical protein